MVMVEGVPATSRLDKASGTPSGNEPIESDANAMTGTGLSRHVMQRGLGAPCGTKSSLIVNDMESS